MEKVSATARLEQMIAQLKANDCRITPQRYAILNLLSMRHDHPSAETLYEELIKNYPTMSLSTVYKTLNLLKQEGEILELEFSDLGNRYDGIKPYPHPHMICTGCGKIIDPSFLDLDEITERMMKETGFRIVSHRVDFYGICPDCQG